MCGAGYEQSGYGSNLKCTICAAGTCAPTMNSTRCSICPTGTFSPREGSSTCSTCPAGSYSAAPQSTNCSICAGNTFSPFGSDMCYACQFYSISSFNASTCFCNVGYPKVDWACLPTALFALTLLTLPYQEVVLVLHVPLEQLLMVLVQLVVTFARSLHTRHLLTCSTSELQQAQVQQILGSALM